jgi:hypothetical protein
VIASLLEDGVDQALHIAPNTWIADAAQIESNFHGRIPERVYTMSSEPSSLHLNPNSVNFFVGVPYRFRVFADSPTPIIKKVL